MTFYQNCNNVSFQTVVNNVESEVSVCQDIHSLEEGAGREVEAASRRPPTAPRPRIDSYAGSILALFRLQPAFTECNRANLPPYLIFLQLTTFFPGLYK
jgi:hypothetical protein